MIPPRVKKFEEHLDDLCEKINGDDDDVIIQDVEAMDKSRPESTPVKMTVIVE